MEYILADYRGVNEVAMYEYILKMKVARAAAD